jgi:uncharacterized protein YoxC
LEISAVIVSLAFLLLVIFIIPSVIQLRRTAKSVSETSNTLNQKLPDILVEINDITNDVSTTTDLVKTNVTNMNQATGRLIELIREFTTFGETLQYSLRNPLMESIVTLTAVFKGMNAFINTLKNE